jgi:hypothetical protein
MGLDSSLPPRPLVLTGPLWKRSVVAKWYDPSGLHHRLNDNTIPSIWTIWTEHDDNKKPPRY